MSGMGRSGAVIGKRHGSRDGEWFAESKHAASIACVQVGLAMCLVKRTVKSVDDTSVAGVSCVRRMAAWRCDETHRGSKC